MESRNGENTYSVRDVEQFLNNIKENYDSRISVSEEMIGNLKRQNQELQSLLKKHIENEQQLSMALRNAEQKSHSVEASLKNMYELKTRQMALIYKRIEKNLSDLQRKYQNFIPQEEISNLTSDFRLVLTITAEGANTQNNYYNQTSTEQYDDFAFSKDVGYKMQHNHKSVMGKSIDEKLNEGFSTSRSDIPNQSTAEQFLSGEVDSSTRLNGLGKNRMNNIIPRHLNVTPKKSDGFSLEEALIPNQSLEEIMLAFDIDIDDKK